MHGKTVGKTFALAAFVFLGTKSGAALGCGTRAAVSLYRGIITYKFTFLLQ